MKLDLLNSVMTEVTNEIEKLSLTSRKYYLDKKLWYDIDSQQEVDSETFSKISWAQLETDYYGNKTAWYYIDKLSAVVAITFKSYKKPQLRKIYREIIDKAIINSSNAFNVSHNPLTGLFAREYFRDLVKQKIEDHKSTIKNQSELATENDDFISISLLAFDIDKFKQVNDTYGHIYGDQILKTFAFRLEALKTDLIDSYKPKIQIELAHPSGEEFFALLIGPLTENEVRTIAERFREKISGLALPSDIEWNTLKSKSTENVALPPLYERKITVSIGVSSYGDLQLNASVDIETMELFNKADIALYRSKSGGRDRVTLSKEILQKCGRTLEHDLSTGVIAIDIGTNSDVLVGQEFIVYPPTYVGNTPYIEDDGRSKKTIGVYPKVEVCRVVVFNSQKEISFAYISNAGKLGNNAIPVSSHLEAIPLGHITHLIESPQESHNLYFDFGTSSILGWKEIKNSLDEYSKNDRQAYVAIFRFKNEISFLQKYGSAEFNRTLARLYSDIKSKFNYKAKIGLIDKTSICVFGESEGFPDKQINSVLESENDSNDEFDKICGYCGPDDNNSDKLAKISIAHYLDLARFTTSNLKAFENTNLNIFSTELAEKYLGEQRNSQLYDGAISDYFFLKEMGVESATIENIIGLCYSALKNYPEAMIHCELAIKLKPDSIVYRGNHGIMSYRSNETEKGLKYLSELSKAQISTFAHKYPFAFTIYALLLLRAKKENLNLFDKEKFIEIGSKAIELKDVNSLPNLVELQNELTEISN